MKKELGIVILATNAYFILGLRFVRRFLHFYKGEMDVKFYFFSDKNPTDYLPTCRIEYHQTEHKNWVDGTNSKFKNILKLRECSSDWLFYFDADTNIQSYFSEEWMIPEFVLESGLKLIGGEHYANRTTLKDGAGFDRNPIGNSYVPETSDLPYIYHYGAFFGGIKSELMVMMEQLAEWQTSDQKIHYEPPVNDESYINKYFHYNPLYTVPIEGFRFVVSDKGGLGNTRDMKLKIEDLAQYVKQFPNLLWDLQNKNLEFQ